MVSVDDLETNKQFGESIGASFPLLSNPGGDVASAFGVLNTERGTARRWTFIIGPDGNILRVDRNVSPSTAGEDLVAHLTELGVQ